MVRSSGSLQECSLRMSAAWCWWIRRRNSHNVAGPCFRSRRGNEVDWKDFQASLAQAHESRVPEGIPVVLITATVLHVLPIFLTAKQKELFNEFMPMWLKFHKEWVEKLPNGQHIITNNSGHSVAFEEPELIVRVIRQMVEQAKTVRT